jgi:NADH dehydrogenase [ubiquinone] 1 alpha subcomplex assembly factor 5
MIRTVWHKVSMTDSMTVFNRQVVRQHRDRAASNLTEHDFLFREVGTRLLDRLDDVIAKFPVAVDLGCRTGLLAELRDSQGGIESLYGCDLSERMMAHSAMSGAVADEEALPFADAALDLVISNLSLHWVNDLPGCMTQVRRALKPDGLFLATMFGGETLHELRAVLSEAEIAVQGGLSPRVSPFTDIRDAGALLQRAGFALPVVDTETITVSYSDPLKLLHDLRGMGEANAVMERRLTAMRRETMMMAMQLYMEKYAGDDGRVPATFQILTLSGWAPSPTQQQPLKPGQGETSLTKFLANDGD